MYTTDSYFHIGATHLLGGKPCQDYALNGTEKDVVYAIVSDGCSSGGLTDVGSRIVAHSTRRSLVCAQGIGADNFREMIDWNRKLILDQSQYALGLQDADMLATCSYVTVRNEAWVVHVVGDGIVVKEFSNGDLELNRISWRGNTPHYPSYAGETYARFMNFHTNDDATNPFTVETWISYNDYHDSEYYNVLNTSLPLYEAITKGYSYKFTDDHSQLVSVAVFTDGVDQIQGVDWKDAARELMAFKNFKGDFFKRRMIKALKTYAKDGNIVKDDIAGAIIRRG